MKLEDLKVGMKVKWPTRKTLFTNLDTALSSWLNQGATKGMNCQVIEISNDSSVKVQPNSSFRWRIFYFTPEDLDAVVEEREYKIGDKVRIVGNTANHGCNIGEIVTISNGPTDRLQGIVYDIKSERTGMWGAYVADFEPVEEKQSNEPTYNSLFYKSNLLILIRAFEEQLKGFDLGYKGVRDLAAAHGYGDNIAYLCALTETKICKEFNLDTQFSEALEFAKQLAKEYQDRKPKEVEYNIRGYKFIFSKEGIKFPAYSDKVLPVSEIKDIVLRWPTSTLFGHHVGVHSVKIGCQEFTLDNLREIFKEYEKTFGK